MLVRESISQFVRGGDPRGTLKIGARTEIELWFAQWVPKVKYVVDENLNIIAKNHFNLAGSQVTRLPDNLTVDGWVDLMDSQISYLPDNLTIDSFLDLRNTPIVQLPKNLRIGSSLYLIGTSLTQIPDGTKVDGFIYINPDQLQYIPADLENIIKYDYD